MSSNIGSEAQAKYKEYLDATSIDEKIKKLEQFLSLIPKHKATEKIVALNKSRLAKLKREKEDRKRKSTAKVVSPFSIKKEGIQLIFISDYYNPGVGKTALLNFLTGAAKDQIGSFNALPEVGIYKYEGIGFQIVDMPAIMEDASKGVGNGKEILAQIRACDLICICIDLTRNIGQQLSLLKTELSNADIRINEEPPPLDIEKTGSNKIQIFYLTKQAKEIIDLTDRIKEIIRANGIVNCVVKVNGKITIDQVLDTLNPSMVYKKAILIGTKGDLPHTEEKFELMEDQYSDEFPIIIGTSVKKAMFPDNFGEIILNYLEKIKIYTMNAGIVAEKPLLVNKGAKVRDVALKIHRSFLEKFDFATVIREGARQERKRVGLEYKLKDEDIVEIHIL
ncbi:MAG: TGS domain-containing protein [Candidatus Lokiarchaeota archaeon]|nr:TGS domain-containing protein [Candidatus Lokiarchaeota archaeon]MBD3199541.1 TGS domain-containing protein [Candidatus Lokiarchaeota archaeon]